MTDWPKHPDGRNKKMGEMTPDERREQFRASLARLKAEFEDPRKQAAIKAAFDKFDADNVAR